MKQGAKRARTGKSDASDTAYAAAGPSAGRPQLLLVKTELQSWLGKKYCNEAELLPMLLAHSIVRHVRTIEVEVRPLGGDSFKVALDVRRPLVSEAKAEIARTQGTREAKQELYKVAIRSDGGVVREDDAEPELLDEEDMELGDGEIVAMAVKDVFEPLLMEEERTLEGHTGCVECMAVHGDKLISGGGDGLIKIWNTNTWTCERTLEGHDGDVYSLVVHGDKLISGGGDKTIKIWNTDTWACERTLEGHHGGMCVSSLVVHGDKLFSGDRAIKLWNTDTWACERTLEGHTGLVYSLVVYGDKLISSSKDGTIKIWSTSTWACERTLEGHAGVWSLMMHGDKLISGSDVGTIEVWSTSTWACERTLEDPTYAPHDGEEAVACLVGLGGKLFAGSSGTFTSNSSIKVWGSA
jgi:WD40 repeat protein